MPLDSPFDSLRGITRRRGSTAFTPAALFASGEPGAWYDPSDLATLYQDSVGTVPVTADGDPVGMMLDKRKGLVKGPELVTDGGFDLGTVPSGWSINTANGVLSIVDGRLQCENTSGAGYIVNYTLSSLEVGKFYQLKWNDTTFSGSGVSETQGSFTNIQTFATGADQVAIFQATQTTMYLYWRRNNGAGESLDNVSVRELPGNHATQATSATRPTYRTDGTLHWLESDGVDDFLVRKSPAGLTAVSEVFAIVAGNADTTGVKGIFSASSGRLGNDESWVLFRPAGSKSGFSGIVSFNVLYSYGVSASADFITALDLGSSDQNFRLNGSIVNQTTVSTSGFAFGDSITIGTSDDTSSIPQFWNGRFYGALLLGRRATSKEISDTESYFADKSGVTL